MKLIIIYFPLLMFACLACEPYQFMLNERQADIEEISCLKICPLDSVDVYAKNAFTVHSGGFVDMRCYYPGITQLRSDFTTEITEGIGVNFSFRTISDNFENQPKLTFFFTTEGCNVFENNNEIVKVDSIKAKIGEKYRIVIENYGNLYNIVVNCDTVYYGKTSLPATEHMIIRTLNGSSAKLSGIVFSDMNEDIDEFRNEESTWFGEK